jgi:hypothetical protein
MLLIVDPSHLGDWKHGCGVWHLIPKIEVRSSASFLKYIFIHHELKETWKGARDYCCQLGMSLLTIYSVEKQSCLYDTMKNIMGGRHICLQQVLCIHLVHDETICDKNIFRLCVYVVLFIHDS